MVYLGEGGQGGWGEVVLPSPGSEPPPPYSPPRVPHHHHFFPQGFPQHHHYYHHPFSSYYDLTSSQPSSLSSHDTPSIKDPPPPYPPTTTIKAAHAALNHGPSSAFSPPTKTIKYSYPPPYTPADTTSNTSGHVKAPPPHAQQLAESRAPGNRDLPRHTTDPRHRTRSPHSHCRYQQEKTRSLDHRSGRHRTTRDNSRSSSGLRRVPAGVGYQGNSHASQNGYPGSSRSVTGSGHPRGPLLRTGKSLELPHERLTHHQPPPTAHTHPHHPHLSQHHTKDISQQQQPQQHTKEPHGATKTHSKSNRLAYVGILPTKTARGPDRAAPVGEVLGTSRCEHQWVTRASRLEAAAAQAMTAARAVPVTAVNSHAQPAESEIKMTRGRLRSCRSLDELSDLLEEEALVPRLHPVATRSLDDLTEPLYENFDVIHAHARRTHERTAHNTSVPDLLEPPPRPPRQRNSSLSSLLDDIVSSGSASLSRRGLNISVPDVLEGGGLSWSSPTSTLRSSASATVAAYDRDTTSDIGVQLEKIKEVARVLGVKYRRGELSSSSASSSGAGSTHTSPRVPQHSHTILTPPATHAPGVPARAPVIHDVLREGRKSSPQQTQQKLPAAAVTHDTDAISQESGYSSVDSRCYRQQQQQHSHQHQSPPQPNKQQQQHGDPYQITMPKQQQHSKNSPPRYQTNSTDSHLCPLQPQSYHRLPQVNTKNPQQLCYQPRDARQIQEEVSGSQQSCNHSRQQYSRRHNRREQGAHQQQQQHYPKEQQHYQKDQQQKLQQRQHHYPKDQQQHKQPVQQLQLQQGVNQDKLGIYIKSVVPGGAADQDGRLQAGDQLLSVDGKSLIGITQERAAEYMMETGPVVTLEVARQGAIYHGLATILSQPSPHVNRGYPGGRHLSERDLPSKVLGEHNQDSPAPSHLHQAPRMQASKSVPSLNSEAGSSGGGKPASLEVFNPSYSRTSSNTSLSQPPNPHFPHHPHHQHHHQQQQQQQQQQHQQQQQQPPVRSRSTQNLSDGSYQGLVGRHPSNPSLVVEEERYYQNVNFHQGPQDFRMGSTRTRPSQVLPMGSPASQESSEQMRPDPRLEHRPASAFMQREDMMPHRSELQRPASQRDLRADAKMLEMTEEVRRREERARHNGHPPASQPLRSGQPQPSHRLPNAFPPSGAPFSPEGYGGSQGFPGQHSGYHQTPSQPPINPQGTVPGLQHTPQHAHPQYSGHAQTFPGKLPPPTAPKPKSQGGLQSSVTSDAPEKPSRQFGSEGNTPGDGPPRPPPPEEGYRDSPPPPPPPTSTHPLLQGNRPASSVGHSSQLPAMNTYNKTSPWDREQKELHDLRRREAARHWRDEQISSLESLEVRTSQQDERLRTLRLEREFQRRAEEALTNDDDDDEDGDDNDKEVSPGNDSENNLRRGPENNIVREYKPSNTTQTITSGQEPRMNGGGPVDEERARKVDEIRRKQQELEAAREAEERLLREAQRRQQEEQMRRFQQEQQQQQQQQQQLQQAAPPQHPHYQHQHRATQRLDSLVATPFHSQYSNGPVNGIRGPHTSYSDQGGVNESSHRLETVVTGAQHSPVPPERGSSYSVMQQQAVVPTQPGANNRYKSPDAPQTTIKRVQFSETTTGDAHITYDNNANQEKTPRQDPNNFINEAETLLNSSPTRSVGGSTPGVIGAQEVYRDPRMRRLQQKQAEQAAAKNPGPEKLTFKEKMKMFAMETGEAETPKEKVKISRAQRDIEH